MNNSLRVVATGVSIVDQFVSPYGEKGNAVFRDADSLDIHYGHAGIFLGNNRWTGGQDKFINAPGIQFHVNLPIEIVDKNVQVDDFTGFLTDINGPHTYWGVRDNNPNLNWRQRNQVIAAAIAQLGSSYRFHLGIKVRSDASIMDDNPYLYYNLNASGSNLTNSGTFRCDGLVEFSYEHADVDLFTDAEKGEDLWFHRNELRDHGMSPLRMMMRMGTARGEPPIASNYFPAPDAVLTNDVDNVHCDVTDQNWGSGVEKVEFYLPHAGSSQIVVTDDHPANVEDSYHAAWDTVALPNERYTLGARVWDQSGNWRLYNWQIQINQHGNT